MEIHTKEATILFADIFAYSMLMEYSEMETHLLSTKAIELATKIVSKHRGNITQDAAGDGIIYVFASAEDAISAALLIQSELTQKPIVLSNGELILFKVGINAGEVLVDENKCVGIVVNMAARIQQRAKAGQVLISGSVHSQISESTQNAFKKEDISKFKNIKNIDTIYSFNTDASATLHNQNTRNKSIPKNNTLKPILAIAPTNSTLPDAKTQPISAVFNEILSTNIERFKDFDIKPPLGVATHVQDPAAILRMCRLENVSYIVQSSLLPKSSSTYLISCQLVDVISEKIFWGDSFSFSKANSSNQLAYFVELCSIRIWASIRNYEEQNRTSLPIGQKEYAAFLNARKLVHAIKKNKLQLGVTLLKSVIKAFPRFMPAQIELSHAYQLAWRYDWVIENEDQLSLSINTAKSIISEDPFNSGAYRELGYSQLFDKDTDNALKAMEHAVELNPLDVMAIANLAEGYTFMKQPKQAIKLIQKSLALNSNTQKDWRTWSLADAYYVAKKYDEVISAVDEMKDPSQGLRLKAASLANLGRIREAKAVSKKILKSNPDFKVSNWRKKQPDSSEAEIDHFCDGLLKAGLPK